MVVLLNIVFTHTYRGPMTDNYWRHRQEGFYFFYLFKLETVNNSAAKKKNPTGRKPLIFGIIQFAYIKKNPIHYH